MSILKKSSLENEILQYLQKKYGRDDPFKILSTNCQSMFSKAQESKALSEKYPEDIITVIKYKKYGKTHIGDNYVEISRREELSRAYEDLIKGIYPKYTVRLHSLRPVVLVLPDDMDLNTPADRIIRHKDLTGPIINLNVVDDVRQKEARLSAMKDLILSSVGRLNVNIAYCSDANDRGTGYLSGHVRINSDLDLSKIRWQAY